jgi:hypothetical protein
MPKTRDRAISKAQIRCPHCGRPLETNTTVRTAPGAGRTFSAEPGELTICECGKMLEYHGQPGKLTLKLARPDRVRAFRELERECSARVQLSTVVEYVRTFRSMPHEKLSRISGTARFAVLLRS